MIDEKTGSAQQLSKYWMDLAPQMMRRMRVHVMEAAVGTLTMPQYRILANINRGLNSVGAIAEHHGVAQPSMSKMVNLMVSRGLIERETHSEDKRQTILTLTEVGRALFFKVRSRAQKKIAEDFQSLSVKEIEQLEKSFATIAEVFKKWV